MESSAPPPYDRHVGRYGERLARGLIEFAGEGGWTGCLERLAARVGG